MKRILLSAATSLLALATVLGCQESAPSVQHNRSIHRTLPPGRLATAAKKVTSKENVVRLTSDAAPAETDACGNPVQPAQTECAAWIQEINHYDEATGDFEYLSTCADGGDVASIHSVGHGDGQGNGAYTQTSALRDGSEIIWSYTYRVGEDGASQIYEGTSTDGTTYAGTYRYPSEGVTDVQETYTYANNTGVSTVEGIYDAQQRFTGTQTFDDPATPDSPDSRLVQTQNDDGLNQEYQYVFEGWSVKYSALYPATGGLVYAWRSDDRSTSAIPDYEGSYNYASDNSGTGSYVQKFDDGSSLDVSHVIAADGSYDENWVWHDASTAQDPDQTGNIHYGVCDEGVGSVTTFVEGGTAETCDLHVALDGTTTTDNCH